MNFIINPFTGELDATESGASMGDVQGPASSTNDAVARFDGITGKIIQNSTLILNDAGSLTFPIAQGIQSGTTIGDTVNVSAYDTVGLSYIPVLIATAQNPAASALGSLNYTVIGGISPDAATVTTLNVTQIAVFEAAQAIDIRNPGAYPYEVLESDYLVMVDTAGGARTIQLPDAPTQDGQVFVIKDSDGNAAANNITLTTLGGVVTIDGATSVVMTANWQSLTVVFSSGSYYII